ncbi:DUF6503 family protein [Nonlabens antarcticus]|uniref:DUF6503 family protein n=1 Tax=Nonlabens antarcticus TaxID=392714 RepID=UPI001890C693|nr:DUF6503 family protein [Nonlabens antarcticus]
MSKLVLPLLAILLLVSCREQTDKDLKDSNPVEMEVQPVNMGKYSQNLQDVFAAHGGLEKWNNMHSLTFTMPGENKDEVQTIDLKTRKTFIKTEKYDLGFDGEKIWLQQDSTYFKPERAEFYYNLMFYFYAMPFVLADDGITYTDVPALEMNGVSYPGIKVSYDAGIGNSPDDEYILYYDPSTKQMAWLSYTVTYGKEGKSDKLSYINYNKWQEINGLLLPEELTWYNVENGKPTEPSGPARKFTKVDIDAAAMDNSMYEKPSAGVFVNE